MPFLAPVIAPIIAFAATPIGGIVVNLAITAVTTLVSMAINKFSEDEKQKAPGFRLNTSFGDNGPLTFLIGRSATAGTRRYISSFGVTNGTPGAFLVVVDQLSNLSIAGNQDVTPWVNGSKCTVLWSETPNNKGYPIKEFRDKDGKDHAWIWVRTGDETTVDSYLSTKFGSHPKRPWRSTSIGTNAPSVIMTFRINREYFSGEPKMFYEVEPTKFYDFRLDSTNGGSGSARWNDVSTYTRTSNPVVIAYNIARGIYRDGRWLYGGRNLPAHRFNISTWIAAANVCDQTVTTSAGDELRYRCGGEIDCSAEPLTAIQELMVSCNGRFAFTGTQFEVFAGSPGASTYSFTDDDLLISRPQGFREFEGFQQIFNAVQASTPNPKEMFALKPLPLRKDNQFVIDDGGLALASGINFNLVPFRKQGQRLTRTLLKEGRRNRTHTMFFPPAAAWSFTAGSVVDWTSASNGYSSKKFVVQNVVGEAGMMQEVTIRETDPNDYDFSISDEITETDGDLTVDVVEVQMMTGWSASPVTLTNDNNEPAKASISVQFAGELEDIRAVDVEVRKAGDTALAFVGSFEYDIRTVNPSAVVPAALTGSTDYEVRGRFVPISGRPTVWSNQDVDGVDGAWLAVTTNDVRVFKNDLSNQLQDWRDWAGGSVSEIHAEMQEVVLQVAENTAATEIEMSNVRTGLASAIQTESVLLTADYTLGITTVATDLEAVSSRVEVLEVNFENLDTGRTANASAINALTTRVTANESDISLNATAVIAVDASLDDVTAGGLLRMSTDYTPASGWNVRAALEVRINDTVNYQMSGIQFEIKDGAARTFLVGDEVYILDNTGAIAAMFESGTTEIKNARIRNLTATNITAKSIDADDILVDGTLITDLLATNSVTKATSASAGNKTVDGTDGEKNLISKNHNNEKNARVFVIFNSKAGSINSNYPKFTFKLKRNGNTISTKKYWIDDIEGERDIIFNVPDEPGNGIKTYSVTANVTSSAAANFGAKFENIAIHIESYKR